MVAVLTTDKLVDSTAHAHVAADLFALITPEIGCRTKKMVFFDDVSLGMSRAYRTKYEIGTGSYLNAMTRLVDRRAKLMRLISENGANFLRANREFK